ncbi:50S ribosomal protein L18 [Pajaroellobacter abortibovis]|uniref:Large ribosomal subunit protein uL18 n=1 Tax=Pajaroellobacter abortibovis TaxID=1882918 RepID=A0A1L6MY40_9BACT|nr:50S ribosomal protein L18 [Pajaroellobacter abortibovis]APS00419.1 50S ribosomal protein L18 [Pajaroellobacter abortibovis]
MVQKLSGREKRKLRIRKKVFGTSERPRLTVFRSAKHIYLQAIDDMTGKTVGCASTLSSGIRKEVDGVKKMEAAHKVGGAMAKCLLEKGIQHVVFDRNGYLYHGRIKTVADATREAGLCF